MFFFMFFFMLFFYVITDVITDVKHIYDIKTDVKQML